MRKNSRIQPDYITYTEIEKRTKYNRSFEHNTGILRKLVAKYQQNAL